MKRIYSIFFFLVLLSASIRAQDTLPAWQKGWMDIHTIAVGAGECTFVIMPDGTTMMIDAGDVTKASKDPHNYPNFMDDPNRTVGERIAEYVLDFSKDLPRPAGPDYFLLTHFHGDHMGQVKGMLSGANGYGLSGITQVGEYLSFGKFVDRGWPDYDEPSRERVESFNKGFMPEYRKFLEYQSETKGSAIEKFEIASRRQFRMCYSPKDYDFEVWNLAAAGRIVTGRGKGVRKAYGKDADPMLFDENTNSCALVMRYGPFTYYNGGDICGKATAKGTKLDIESQIADLCGQMTVIKTDHHGWKDSTNPYFLWKTRPQVVLIPAYGNTHPWIETLRRLSDTHYGIKGIFATTASAEPICKEEMKHITAIGHIVVRVYEGGRNYQVFVLDRKDNDYKVLYASQMIQP